MESFPDPNIGSNNTKVQFKLALENYTNEVSLINGGKGMVFKLTSNTSVEFEGYLNSNYQVENKISLTVSTPTTSVIYSSQFQPEDRYGYIQNAASQSDTNGTGTTTNNCVKVVNNVNALTDLHIKFFSDSAGTNRVDTVDSTVTGSVISPYGIKLNPNPVAASGSDPAYPNIDGTQYTAGSGTAASP